MQYLPISTAINFEAHLCYRLILKSARLYVDEEIHSKWFIQLIRNKEYLYF